MKSICFITTGDIINIATAKRALGLANHLIASGWKVYIIMEDTEENRHRAKIECCEDVNIYFLTYNSAIDELKKKNHLISQIKPNYIYICAFVFRNIITSKSRSVKLVEHSELQSAIQNISFFKRMSFLFLEFYSIVYADGILNASDYLQKLFKKWSKIVFWKKIPMLYFPYAYNKDVCYTEKTDDNLRNDKLFVFLGSIVVNYGALVMVKAFEELQSYNAEAKLVMLGKGSDYDFIKKYIEDNNIKNIILKGYIEEEEIPYYFSNASAFLLPINNTVQDKARCPSKLYMYLPYMKPIITSRLGEPYITLGEKGLYFEPGSVHSLINTINDLFKFNNWSLEIEYEIHEWKKRTILFDNWIRDNF